VSTWRVESTAAGLSLAPVVRRSLGSEEFTWADLFARDLARVRAYAIYFPSRFDLVVDQVATDALRAFGQRTGVGTSVNFWDPADSELSRALAFFGLSVPPALVFATGLKVKGAAAGGPDPNLYSIAITDPAVLGDRELLASAANTVHEIIVRGNPDEISGYLRKQSADSVLETVARVAGVVRDQILRFKPKVGLPGGFSVQLG
jgi:hypothetical protein